MVQRAQTRYTLAELRALLEVTRLCAMAVRRSRFTSVLPRCRSCKLWPSSLYRWLASANGACIVHQGTMLEASEYVSSMLHGRSLWKNGHPGLVEPCCFHPGTHRRTDWSSHTQLYLQGNFASPVINFFHMRRTEIRSHTHLTNLFAASSSLQETCQALGVTLMGF